MYLHKMDENEELQIWNGKQQLVGKGNISSSAKESEGNLLWEQF